MLSIFREKNLYTGNNAHLGSFNMYQLVSWLSSYSEFPRVPPLNYIRLLTLTLTLTKNVKFHFILAENKSKKKNAILSKKKSF